MVQLPPAYGGTGDAGFKLGIANNFFGITAGDANATPVSVAPSNTRAAAEATRDTYFTSNPNNLADYDAEGNKGLGVLLHYLDSGNKIIQPQTRVGGEWRDNAAIIAVQGSPGSGTDFSTISENHIPAIGALPDKLPYDSGLRIDSATKRFIANKGIEVPPGTIYIGSSTALSSGIRAVNLRSDVTGNTALIQAQLYDEQSGFSPAFVYTGDAATDININDPGGNDTSNNARFSITTTSDELLTRFTITTNQNSQTIPFDLKIRVGSHSGTVAVSFDGEITTSEAGLGVINLIQDYNPILVDSGTQLFVTVVCQGMLGVTSGDDFTPNTTIRRIVVGRTNIPTGESFTNAEKTKLAGLVAGAEVNVQSDWTEADSSSDSFIQNKPTDLTNLSTHSVTELNDISNSGSGAIITEQERTKLSGIATGASTRTPVQDEGGHVVQSPTAINFVGDGVEVTDVSGVATVTISGVSIPRGHIVYLGVTDDNNAISVNLDASASSDHLNPTLNVPIFSGTKYIQILQSEAHTAFTMIDISGFNQKGGFDTNSNARNIGGQAYRQYVSKNRLTSALSGATIKLEGAS